MHDIRTSSANCGSSEPPRIFPCRLSPKIRKRSPSLRRKSHIRKLAGLNASLPLRLAIARAILAMAQSMCLIAAPTLFESGVRAQTTSRPPSIDQFANFIAGASTRFTVPARWIRAVIEIESADDEHAVSPRGAMGLMQLMPGTWVELSVRYGLGLDPFDPEDNILAGTAYLKEMHDRFGSAGFLAAYHAGPGRYERYRATGEPLPAETTAYVAAVTPLLGNEQDERAAFRVRRAVPWREAPLFVERTDGRLLTVRLHPTCNNVSIQESAHDRFPALKCLPADRFVRQSCEGPPR
jgi:soluble lytic murein transglycosylase-like protein